MAQENSEYYILGRTLLASARLNLQHYLWTQDAGYLIHPNIQVDSEARIADVGTGTGIWVLDQASKFPQRQFDGFDIDLAQIPPAEWLPSNVTFHQWDANAEVPIDMVDKFDIVHVRLFVCVIQDDNPEKILRNLMKLLKPGGWLQWSEVDSEKKDFIAADPKISLAAFKNPANNTNVLDEAQTQSQKKGQLNTSWVHTLPTYFHSNNLTVIATDRQDCSPSLRVFQSQVYILTLEEMMLRMGPEEAKPFREMVRKFGELSRETRNGVAITIQRITVVGRKDGGAEDDIMVI